MGFRYVMNAPTSGMVRRGEDPLTYLNLHQMYTLNMELAAAGHRFKGDSAISVISVQVQAYTYTMIFSETIAIRQTKSF